MKLTWQKVEGASGYILEGKLEGEPGYKIIAHLDGAISTYLEKNVSEAEKAYFRLKGISKSSESADYSYVEIETSIITDVEKNSDEMFTVFPNPIQKGEQVTVQMKKSVKGTLSLLNVNGQSVSDENIGPNSDAVIRIPEHSEGYYFIRFKAGDKIWSKKLLVR